MPNSDLRGIFLNSSVFRSKEVEIEVPQREGAPIRLRVKIKQPTVDERNAIFSAAKVTKDGVSGANLSTGALAIIHCVRHPDSDEKVFSEQDLPAILNTPAGGWVDKLSAEVFAVLNDAAEEAKK